MAGDGEEETQGLEKEERLIKNFLEVKSGNFSNMLLLKVMTYMSVSPNECKGQGHLFLNPMGGKNFGFPWEIFATCKLEGWAKSVQKRRGQKDF